MPIYDRSSIGHHDYFMIFKDEKKFNDKKSIVECYKQFSRNNDLGLSKVDFERLLKSLYRFENNSYYISKPKIQKMFDKFKSQSERIDLQGFELFWFKIIKKTLFPRSALLIVDVQNDFIKGTLSLSNCPSKHDGAEVIPVINSLIQKTPFDVIAYTLDWHPDDHCSFIENVQLRKISDKSPITSNFKTFDKVIFEKYPKIEQKLWPAHCLNDSEGAELHKNLKVINTDSDILKRRVFFAKKGTNPEIDSYSPFFNNCGSNETDLHSHLKSEEITDLYICGIAYDVCVACTAFDALDLNYRVCVVNDACRGVDLKSIREQKEGLVSRGAVIVNSKQVCY